jgi:hypothetical protein
MKATKKWAGHLGGQVTSEAKTKAVRENGKLGGRPRKHPRCTKWRAHRFWQGRCLCGYVLDWNSLFRPR